MSPMHDEHKIQFEHFFETSRDLLCVLSGDGRLIRTNETFRSTLGYTESSLVGAELTRLVHPDEAAPLSAFLRPREGGDASLKLDAGFLHRDLSYRRLLFSFRRVAGDTKVYGAGLEVEAQEPVDEWERRRDLLQKMQATGRVGGWDVDCTTGRQFWTEETYRIHEVPIGFNPNVDNGISFYAPEHQSIITEAFSACVGEGKPYDLELQIVTAKGRRLWVRTAGTAVMENGKVTRVIGAFQDIDDFKRRETEVEEKLAIIAQQRSEIHALSVPVIQVWDDVLALPVVGGLDEARASEITTRLLDAVVSTRARFAILDLTGVEAVDAGTAERLSGILRAIQLLGAEGLVTGIRPAVAQTFTCLATGFAGARTLSNLREAIKVCMRGSARRVDTRQGPVEKLPRVR
ncbi:PAS domain-containing protein [Polyangium sorediatum]|uniref:PAS domain-containing protein n=1 Tax=Polyangium sorediatum TaxID=889274 RepID=A0ABT6P314_9BACT|nr:PAS domain-containing protein [Polyangium sorediatum]MDI1434997.1 PAS domain-containing protein [Polyangium sorediatum]